MSEPVSKRTATWTRGKIALYTLHWGLIVNMAIEAFYASYMVFSVLRPEGVSGPLWGAAKQLIVEQPDLMHARRAYATEAWIAIVGLSIYLAITEIVPRLQRYRREAGDGAAG